MNNIYGFDRPWHTEIIDCFTPRQFAHDTPSSNAIKCLARANLASACIIAQAIDGLAKAVKDQEQPEQLLTKREHFAALAMQGLLPNPSSDEVSLETIASMACDGADKLIEILDE